MSNGRNLAANTEFSSLRLCIFACEKKRDFAKTLGRKGSYNWPLMDRIAR
jgi:hypothetical protein